MISLDRTLEIHHQLVSIFGGLEGVRDMGLLEAALQRLHSTFDGTELYPTPAAKAAAILESIVGNHPFLDGNKRTGYVLMRLILLENGNDISATQEEKYELVIAVASGQMDFERIKIWIEWHLKF